MLSHVQKYFAATSLVGDLPLFTFAILGVSIALTLWHGNQERQGRLWRYFGAIYGFRFPDFWGGGIFFWGLTLVLWLITIVAMTGLWPWSGGEAWGIAAVGFLIGARLSDTWKSHVEPWRKGYKPNPGLSSTPFYVCEAVALAVIFAPGLINNWQIALGAWYSVPAPFGSVYPSFWAFGPTFLPAAILGSRDSRCRAGPSSDRPEATRTSGRRHCSDWRTTHRSARWRGRGHRAGAIVRLSHERLGRGIRKLPTYHEVRHRILHVYRCSTRLLCNRGALYWRTTVRA
jgi:hypothetical protein